jgi:hypothetical protein
MNSIDIDSGNLCLINFSDILCKCSVNIHDDLHRFNLLESLSFQNKDSKKIIYHHIVHELCDAVVHHLTFNKIVVIYNKDDISKFDLVKYIPKQRMVSFILTTISKIKKLLPIRIYESDICFNDINIILKNGNGERAELIFKLQQCVSKVTNFEKVKKFASRYDLTFLSKTFFNKIKTKNLMFS